MDGQEIVTGGEEQIVAESDVTIDTEATVTETPDDVVEETEATNTRTEEDSRFASVRRKAEEEARAKYDSKSQAIDAEFKRLFGEYKNPVTGKNIEGYQDYLDAIEAQNKAEMNSKLESAGIDPKVIEQMINNSPAVRQANEVMKQNQLAEAERQIEADIKAICEIDPSIKGKDELFAHPSMGLVREYVNKGLNLVEAYKLANYDSLASKKTEAVKQAAINQAKSKSHLEKSGASGSSGKEEVEIPSNEIETWRSYYPGLSDSELRKKYNKNL